MDGMSVPHSHALQVALTNTAMPKDGSIQLPLRGGGYDMV